MEKCGGPVITPSAARVVASQRSPVIIQLHVRASHIRVASNLQAVRASQMQERESFEIVHGHMFGESSTLVAERVIRPGVCLANEAKVAMIVRRAAAPICRSGV